MRRLSVLASLTLALAWLVWYAPVDAGTKSVDQVKAKATLSKPDAKGKQTVTITVDIAKGWHIYANPVGNEILEPGQTKVKIAKVKFFDVTYPKGKIVVDGQDKYSIYEGRVVIKADIERAAGDTGSIEVSINVQACTEKTCLLPGTVKLTVP